jgi:hypothetical protein
MKSFMQYLSLSHRLKIVSLRRESFLLHISMMVFLFLLKICTSLHAQTIAPSPQRDRMQEMSFMVEVDPFFFTAGGYGVAMYWNTPSRFTFGLGMNAGRIEGFVKGWAFTSSDLAALAIDHPIILGFTIRYRFSDSQQSFFAEVPFGSEVFRIRSGGDIHDNWNVFAVPRIGYTWFPFGEPGFYVSPRFGINFLLNSVGERRINNITYRLNDFFLSPVVVLGWYF